MIEFFLRRPIFAAVCAIIITLAGAVAIPQLAIAQFPRVQPPVVTVTSNFVGASAATVESSVTTPLEQQINGVDGLRYISSTSTNDGISTITCTFDLTRDLDRAASDVLSAVQAAQGRLPDAVRRNGVVVTKNSGTFILGIGLYSTNAKYDNLFLSNYADLYINDSLKRIKGVNDVRIFGERRYAMRLWLDPKKLLDNHLTPNDIVTALNDQNVVVASGAIGQPPVPENQPYQINVRTVGRLTDARQFANLIVRNTPDGGHVRLSDVGRAELGAESYNTLLRFNGQQGVGLGIVQLPTSNALDVANQVKAAMAELEKKFPPGVHYKVAFDATSFVTESINEVIITLVLSIVLVIIVIYLFLQDWRTTLIPAITIPVSLVGTFFLMQSLGFSINTLTLFGLTLATGLVVDDAIVVIENIARLIAGKASRPAIESASIAMKEISSAVIASSLVLIAVFIPVAFFPGTTGQLYKQFALTIVCSIVISLFTSLTLTPVLSAMFIRRDPKTPLFLRPVNAAIHGFTSIYSRALRPVMRFRYAVLGGFVVCLAALVFLFQTVPTGFIPDEDLGYFFVTVQAPEGTSISYERNVAAKVVKVLRTLPEVVNTFDVGGFNPFGTGSNRGFIAVLVKPWGERKSAGQTLEEIIPKISAQLGQIPEATVLAFNPPAIQGLGSVGGFQFELLDRANAGIPTLAKTASSIVTESRTDPALRSVFTTFSTQTPQLVVNVEREKAESLGVPLANIFSTMGIALGSAYVNDFDYLNRSYRVYVQADAPYRTHLDDLSKLYVSSTGGGSTPLTSLITYNQVKTAPIINHYNLFRSIELSGNAATGKGSGDAITAMKAIADRVMPAGFAYTWSGLSLEQVSSGNQSALIFALGLVFVFLVLAAQYESFTQPFIILLTVPLGIFGALLGLYVRHIPSDVYAQVGFVMLIGLSSKAAILIVEFANQLREQGVGLHEAAMQAAITRLRPILMTSIAFILAVSPLVFATGAGAVSRHSLGTTVFGGMLLSSIFNLMVVPVFYVLVIGAMERVRGKHSTPQTHESASVPTDLHDIQPATVGVAPDGSLVLRYVNGGPARYVRLPSDNDAGD